MENVGIVRLLTQKNDNVKYGIGCSEGMVLL